MIYKSKISNYKIKKIINYFCLYLTPTQRSKIRNISRELIDIILYLKK